jgi:hypothetical protein
MSHGGSAPYQTYEKKIEHFMIKMLRDTSNFATNSANKYCNPTHLHIFLTFGLIIVTGDYIQHDEIQLKENEQFC